MMPVKGGAGRGGAGRGGAGKGGGGRRGVYKGGAKISDKSVKRQKKLEDGEESEQDCEAGAGSSSS